MMMKEQNLNRQNKIQTKCDKKLLVLKLAQKEKVLSKEKQRKQILQQARFEKLKLKTGI